MTRTGIWLLAAGCSDSACGETERCLVETGEYFAFPPSAWDGVSPLEAVVHFHGYGGDPSGYFDNATIQDAFDAADVMVVYPAGKDEMWNVHATDWSDNGRDDLAFVDEVIADVRARWPVARVDGSGFSVGSAILSTVACAGGRFNAIAAWSGTFWDPIPAACAAPVPVLQVHGDADDTWPMAGRDFGEGESQGAIGEAMDLWRAVDASIDPSAPSEADGVSCEAWAGAAALMFCHHAGGHERTDDWVPREVAFFRANAGE